MLITSKIKVQFPKHLNVQAQESRRTAHTLWEDGESCDDDSNLLGNSLPSLPHAIFQTKMIKEAWNAESDAYFKWSEWRQRKGNQPVESFLTGGPSEPNLHQGWTRSTVWSSRTAAWPALYKLKWYKLLLVFLMVIFIIMVILIILIS